MPETVQRAETPGDLRVGDKIVGFEGSAVVSGKTITLPVTVGAVVGRGNANVTVHYASAVAAAAGDRSGVRLILRNEPGAVTVERTQPTTEERVAEAEARVIKDLQSYEGAEARSVEKLNATIEKHGYAYAFGWGHVAEPVDARVKEHTAAAILAAVERAEGATLLEVIEHFIGRLSEEVLRGTKRALSRSTGVMRNLADDVENAARVEMIEALEYHVNSLGYANKDAR